jgi:hypothetical protein
LVRRANLEESGETFELLFELFNYGERFLPGFRNGFDQAKKGAITSIHRLNVKNYPTFKSSKTGNTDTAPSGSGKGKGKDETMSSQGVMQYMAALQSHGYTVDLTLPEVRDFFGPALDVVLIPLLQSPGVGFGTSSHQMRQETRHRALDPATPELAGTPFGGAQPYYPSPRRSGTR